MSSKNIVVVAILLALALSLVPVSATSQADGGSYPHYDLLIIAPDEFIDELEPLQRFKDASGRPTILLSLSEVYVNPNCSTGVDEPEKIKKCIDHYKTTGIKYVMLVGDSDKFPVRYCKGYNTQWGGPPPELAYISAAGDSDKLPVPYCRDYSPGPASIYFPSDLYYADLYDSVGGFDDWDGDGDTILCEVDFAGGEDINLVNLDDTDLHPDVAVARVPASDEPEVSTYVEKVIDYELRAPGDWFSNALLVVDDDVGSRTKMDNDVAPHLSAFTIYRRYYNDYPEPGWSNADRAGEINARLNDGVGFVCHYGHGNRLLWDRWYWQSYMSALSNSHELPLIFSSSCLTGRFHYDREYYLRADGGEWDRRGGPWPPVDYPEPATVQGSQYDEYGNESFAEHFLVKDDAGAIAYIGAHNVTEHGQWLSDPAKSVGLAPYFFEAYGGHVPGTTTVGDMWQTALDKFADDVEVIAQFYYAFVQIHKFMLFGDPSLRVGGAFTFNRSGDVWDDEFTGGPWWGYERYRIVGDVTVPVGETLTAYPASSVLFEDGRKITAPGSDPGQGFRMNGTSDEPAWFVTLGPDPQSEHVVQGVKVAGQLRLRNGGQIKVH